MPEIVTVPKQQQPTTLNVLVEGAGDMKPGDKNLGSYAIAGRGSPSATRCEIPLPCRCDCNCRECECDGYAPNPPPQKYIL
ncbi:hypothetical protein HZB01_01085 [Candidatus Woesearchaeota archaeon]|nr:hypothetical protein [Candidatus Woesearchaeota archaeon]